MGPAPVEPNTRSRLLTERNRVRELVPYAVVFPYRRMGQQLSGFSLDTTQGAFGPFADQIFIGDYTLSILMRATTEQVNGVWQGACYPFREGFATGLLANQFTPKGQLIVGGTNRGWPVRGPKPQALQRVEWTGKTPFEIREIRARPDGFLITFTRAVDLATASMPEHYRLETFTHIYHRGYGSPEVDQTVPKVRQVSLLDGGRQAYLTVQGLVQGHVHAFDLDGVLSAEGGALVHSQAYYTLNEIPKPSPLR